ncbi:hypothetical protein AVEN_199272-1 [Araneus ventricosus]|uniref:Retrovirus-related Pol polyprotein from transposon TNT 1-94 n=1 Tax=Araneus ventricosus TaxID=182803 RepID=A0A4Y2JZJ0_ARAVE|nr:hypothetical protein AVEN_199272-1 [Araneus ventricosus]
MLINLEVSTLKKRGNWFLTSAHMLGAHCIKKSPSWSFSTLERFDETIRISTSYKNYKLYIGNIAEISLNAYSDADFASCTDDRISVADIFCGNAPVSWRTAKQKSVTLSSMEAEFLSICETAKELMWLKNVIEEC